MYKFKATITDRKTHEVNEIEANRIETLTREINAVRGVRFIITRNHDNSVAMRGKR